VSSAPAASIVSGDDRAARPVLASHASSAVVVNVDDAHVFEQVNGRRVVTAMRARYQTAPCAIDLLGHRGLGVHIDCVPCENVNHHEATAWRALRLSVCLICPSAVLAPPARTLTQRRIARAVTRRSARIGLGVQPPTSQADVVVAEAFRIACPLARSWTLAPARIRQSVPVPLYGACDGMSAVARSQSGGMRAGCACPSLGAARVPFRGPPVRRSTAPSRPRRARPVIIRATPTRSGS
jgi:hypothetical protein